MVEESKVGLIDYFVPGFAVLLFSVLGPLIWFPQLNTDIFIFFNYSILHSDLPLDSEGWSVVWANITLLGDGIFSLSFASLLILLANRLHPLKSRAFSACVLYGGIGLAIFVQVSKRLFSMERPAKLIPSEEINIIGETLLYNSFPSGHSATVFFTAALLIIYFNIKNFWLVLLIMLIACLGGASRVFVGAHFPADVLAGAMCGWLFGWGFVSLLSDKKHSLAIEIFTVLLTLATSIYMIFYDVHLPGVGITLALGGMIFFICASYNLWRIVFQLAYKT